MTAGLRASHRCPRITTRTYKPAQAFLHGHSRSMPGFGPTPSDWHAHTHNPPCQSLPAPRLLQKHGGLHAHGGLRIHAFNRRPRTGHRYQVFSPLGSSTSTPDFAQTPSHRHPHATDSPPARTNLNYSHTLAPPEAWRASQRFPSHHRTHTHKSHITDPEYCRTATPEA